MGDWESTSPDWWIYRLRDGRGGARAYGYVLRHHQAGPWGTIWDAIVMGRRMCDDITIRERVSLEEAKQAIERVAMRTQLG